MLTGPLLRVRYIYIYKYVLEIGTHLGSSLGRAKVSRFADGEVNIQVQEHVRGKDVFIIQPTCPPVNDNLMELLLLVSTLRRSSAKRITAVIPYYGYARQVFSHLLCWLGQEDGQQGAH